VIKYSSLGEATAWSEEAFCTSHGHQAVAAEPVVAFFFFFFLNVIKIEM
jgi:hypothetical protein